MNVSHAYNITSCTNGFYKTKNWQVQTLFPKHTETVVPRETRARFCPANTTTQPLQNLRWGYGHCQMYFKQSTCQIKWFSVWLIMNTQVKSLCIFYRYNITHQIPGLRIQGTLLNWREERPPVSNCVSKPFCCCKCKIAIVLHLYNLPATTINLKVEWIKHNLFTFIVQEIPKPQKLIGKDQMVWRMIYSTEFELESHLFSHYLSIR